MNPELSLMIVAGMVPASVFAYLAIGVVPPWWASRVAGAPLGFFDVLRMRFAGVNAWWVVKVATAARARGEEDVTYEDVAEAYLDGVDLREVYAAMNAASVAGGPPESFAVLANRYRFGGPLPLEEESPEEGESHEESPGDPSRDAASQRESSKKSPEERRSRDSGET